MQDRASPTSGANYTEENEGSEVYRTDSAQNPAGSENRNVKFPKVIRHRKAEVTLGLLNITDQNYNLNPLNLYNELPRSRTLALRLQLNF